MQPWPGAAILLLAINSIECAINRAPQFLPGGDMTRFSLPEDTQVGAPVYRLQGADPEGAPVHYSISGHHFEVDRISGIVSLVKPLDRESLEILEVIISITDESVGGAEPNTVSLRREIPVLDVNDNSPEFLGRPYSLVLVENTKTDTIVYSNITIVDADAAHNAEISLNCISGGCETFAVSVDKIGEGNYRGNLILKKPLDYELMSSYSLTIEASDLSPKKPLSATANIAISIRDVQDQPPVFLNAPYSATLQENSSPVMLQIKAKDGDLGEARPVVLSLEEDTLNYFKLVKNTLVTSHVPIDRENPLILQNGGIYTFKVLINNELPGDFSYERITIVITDVDDQIPQFNMPVFNINVSEDTSIGTPLPGLNMVVTDNDLGDNSHYALDLKSNDRRALDWFLVEPAEAYGRTPVVVRLKDNTGFDYDAGLRHIKFTVVAYGEKLEVSSSDVIVSIIDANDNSPIFEQASYSFIIPENLPPGSSIANITATDIDSGQLGEITYSLRGFGINKFGTNPQNGNLYLTNRVDYEKQKSYSLSLEAKDGGGRVTTVSLLVSLTDVNDNPPVWEMTQYQRTVREGATNFQPQFFIRALDADRDGETKMRYKILTSNSDVLSVDEHTGEVKITTPVSSSHTSRGQYELVVRAFDDGTPPLHADVPVFVRVGIPGNQRPVFRDVPYNTTIPETAKSGDMVLKVRATDPDGPDTSVHYRIANGADNFHIDENTGLITVSSAAILDPDVTLTNRYAVTVLAVDNGLPVRETAQTTVTVNIVDVNNKAPYFLPNANYVRHISEKSDIGKTVVTVKAIDSDLGAQIKYSIIDVRAVHKTGVPLIDGGLYDFKKAFVIDETSGDIKVNSHLSHQSAAVIILTVEAKDVNATINVEQQVAKVEVTLYIQAYDEQNPKFTVGGWSVIEPVVNVSLQEERPIGSTALSLTAFDPTNNLPISRFSLIPPTPSSISLDNKGKVSIMQRIDYETLKEKNIMFSVEAMSNDGHRSSIAHVILNIEDINDHTPEFKKSVYHGQIFESAVQGTPVLTVEATDGDMANTSAGYGDVMYSLSGESMALFTVNSITGEIVVSESGSIDREKQAVLRLTAIASDTPLGGANQRKATVPIIIEVLDVNDNKPLFSAAEFSAVVLENVPKGTPVVNVTATDLDKGLGGSIEYEIVHQSDAAGSLFEMNNKTGEIKTKVALTGKGRTDPYIITIRAQDLGEPSLFSDVPLRIYIGDVVTNDGVPTFIHPTLDEMAYISENSSIGSPVFRVIASDPDNPNSLEGQVRFSFLQDGADSLAFNIDPVTGLITTKENLDREVKSNYTLLLVAQDSGLVPQHATRQLRVTVTDIDDNKPLFKRSQDEAPEEFEIEEELPVGSTVGVIRAVDADVGENAKIGYLITYGNEDGLFGIKRLENNSALINITGRIDRESNGEHLITVKCFKFSATPQSLRKMYNKQDFSEKQIRIKVRDIDDNMPVFLKNNITIGVRINVPHDTLLYTLSAVDEDVDAAPITYSIESIKFERSIGLHNLPTANATTLASAFFLDNNTGELRTATNMAEYYDGHFTIKVSASNREGDGKAFTEIQVIVFVVRDRGLMKFIFTQPPGEVRAGLHNFKGDIEKALALPISLNIYDTTFLSKSDGSLDFSATSSCFQLVGAHTFDLKEMEQLLLPGTNPEIDDIYHKYNVQSVQRCAPLLIKAEVTWVQLCVLAIACFIGIASLISGCVLCCSYN
uniref:Cadherin domain-containing protein n=1 Tax=Rhodnius prolixus TaxID=13249 RepID=T1IAK5_RHOPR